MANPLSSSTSSGLRLTRLAMVCGALVHILDEILPAKVTRTAAKAKALLQDEALEREDPMWRARVDSRLAAIEEKLEL